MLWNFLLKQRVVDVICANELIEHLPDAERALDEMMRVVRKGGRIDSPRTQSLLADHRVCGSDRLSPGSTARPASPFAARRQPQAAATILGLLQDAT